MQYISCFNIHSYNKRRTVCYIFYTYYIYTHIQCNIFNKAYYRLVAELVMGRVCMGRVGYGPSLSWAEFVMGRDVQLQSAAVC